MGIAMSFILGLILRIFQIFCFIFRLSSFFDDFYRFFSIFSFFNQKTSVALAGYGFACLELTCPRSITSGLLGTEFPNSIKKAAL